MKNPVLHYRILSWLTCLFCFGALAACFLLNQRLSEAQRLLATEQHRFRPLNPHELSKYRDRDFEFVIRNYGFEYEGRTGEEIDDWILLCGGWEKDLAFCMRDYLQRRGNEKAVLIDVGCNAGHHSLFLSRYVKQIHAFDPYLPAVERFRKMIDRNGFANILVHPVGLGDKDAELPFLEPIESNTGAGTFRDTNPARAATKKLRIVRGDDWLAQYQLTDVELIKIDIEGFEESALLGLRQALESNRPVVVVEVTRAPEGTIDSLKRLQSLFPAEYLLLGFVAEDKTHLDGNYRLKDFAPAAEEFFSAGFQVNLVAVPAEKETLVPRQRAGK